MTTELARPEKIYGRFDAQGKPTGFWNSDIYPPTPPSSPDDTSPGAPNPAIPADAVEISYTTWDALLADQLTARYVNGAVAHIAAPPIPPETPNPAVAEAVRANARLDAGLAASVATIEDVRDTLHDMPAQFNAQVFAALQLQIKILADTLVAMLQGQASIPPPPS